MEQFSPFPAPRKKDVLDDGAKNNASPLFFPFDVLKLLEEDAHQRHRKMEQILFPPRCTRSGRAVSDRCSAAAPLSFFSSLLPRRLVVTSADTPLTSPEARGWSPFSPAPGRRSFFFFSRGTQVSFSHSTVPLLLPPSDRLSCSAVRVLFFPSQYAGLEARPSVVLPKSGGIALLLPNGERIDFHSNQALPAKDSFFAGGSAPFFPPRSGSAGAISFAGP